MNNNNPIENYNALSNRTKMVFNATIANNWLTKSEQDIIKEFDRINALSDEEVEELNAKADNATIVPPLLSLGWCNLLKLVDYAVSLKERKDKSLFNGFESQKDYEFVLGIIENAICMGYPNGNLSDYVDTLMVTESNDSDKVILVSIDYNDYGLPGMEQHREKVRNIINAINRGEHESEIVSFGYGIVEGLEDGELTVSYDGARWTIPFTEEALLRELLEEELNDIVERFVEFNKADIDEFFRG